MKIAILALDPKAPWITENREVNQEKHRAFLADPDHSTIRDFWLKFALLACQQLNESGCKSEIVIVNRWQINARFVDDIDADLVFVPHMTRRELGPTKTAVLFYMQVMQKWLFTVDPLGWGAESAAYPYSHSTSVREDDTWDRYQNLLTGENVSKFSQAPQMDRDALRRKNLIPEHPFIFFPCQIPHDQSLKLFSEIEEIDLVEALAKWGTENDVHIVMKEHPANRRSMRPLRLATEGTNTLWSEASIHDLARESTAVYTMNSGVGFEALFHTKPLVTFAKAEYDGVTIHGQLTNLDAAWSACHAWIEDTEMANRKRFIDWYCNVRAIDLSAPQQSLDRRLNLLAQEVINHVKT